MTTTSPLPDPRTPVSVPAGSMHVRTRRVRTHARTHALGLCMHARTGPVHAARTGSPRPLARGAHARLLAPGPHARFVSMHARTGSGSPCPLARGAHARMHAPGLHARSLTGSPRTHAPGHACTHVPGQARTLAPGPCAHARSRSPHLRGPHVCMHWAYARSIVGSPCTCAGSLHSCMLHPMLYVVVVICSSSSSSSSSSSTVLYSSIMQ